MHTEMNNALWGRSTPSGLQTHRGGKRPVWGLLEKATYVVSQVKEDSDLAAGGQERYRLYIHRNVTIKIANRLIIDLNMWQFKLVQMNLKVCYMNWLFRNVLHCIYWTLGIFSLMGSKNTSGGKAKTTNKSSTLASYWVKLSKLTK